MEQDNWRDRSSGMRCDTCISFVPKKSDLVDVQSKDVGRCRRHAPTMTGFPVVFPSDWCGDHKIDETCI